jgi:putative hemin transport protein
MNQTIASFRPAHLKQRWAILRHANPQLRIRDAARELAASEAQLVASTCGENTVRLGGDWAELIHGLPRLGRLMALTRNEHAVHERQGTYRVAGVRGDQVRVQGDGIDLTLRLSHWRFGFAVHEPTGCGLRRSLQFFDCNGTAVHKLYLTDDADLVAYEALVASHRNADQTPTQITAPASPPRTRAARNVDAGALRTCWIATQNTQPLDALLHRFDLTRLQALRLLGPRHAQPVATTSLRRVLQSVCDARLPIRITVSNPGASQAHTGRIDYTRAVGNWYSILEADFNLHLREPAIDSAWLVTRPAVKGGISGVVTSLELFDGRGGTIACLQAQARSGIPEDLAWRHLVRAATRA